MTAERITTAPLGTDGTRAGVQGLGCMGMSFAYGPADADASRATLERALELGVTLYDTADMYGSGENERFLAPFFKAHRDELLVATKFALVLDPADPARRIIRNDGPYIRQAVEASLERLGVDVIDLYYMHRRDVNVPIEETVGVMAELVREGKVKQLGLSEVTADELRAAHAVHPIAAVQSEWSLFSRDIEAKVVPAARELGVTLVPYSPLGRGFLTGSFADADKDLTPDDFRRTMPRDAALHRRERGRQPGAPRPPAHHRRLPRRHPRPDRPRVGPPAVPDPRRPRDPHPGDAQAGTRGGEHGRDPHPPHRGGAGPPGPHRRPGGRHSLRGHVLHLRGQGVARRPLRGAGNRATSHHAPARAAAPDPAAAYSSASNSAFLEANSSSVTNPAW